MSTTLIPPSFYVVKAPARPARLYATAAEAAAAIAVLGSTPVAVGVATGARTRGLTESERHDLDRRILGYTRNARPNRRLCGAQCGGQGGTN
jgi:hypothetical protein